MTEDDDDSSSPRESPAPGRPRARPRVLPRRMLFSPATRFDEYGLYALDVYERDARQLVLEMIAGVTSALSVVGESIAFAFILGVGPLVALHATWITALVVAILGSRPACSNGADGVRAAALAPFVSQYGIGYLFYAVMLIAGFYFIFTALRLVRLVKVIPHTVMIGFLNGLALILFIGQVRQLQVKTRDRNDPHEGEWHTGATLGWMFFEIVATVVVILGTARIPKIGRYLPGAIFGILVTTGFEHLILRKASSWSTPTIGTVSKLGGGMPRVFWNDPQYEGKIPPFTWDVFLVVVGPSFMTAGACFVETVLLMEHVDDATGGKNRHPNRNIFAFAVSNLICGIFGTMGGASLSGATILMLMSGASGRYHIPGFTGAVTTLLVVLVASGFIELIPTAALIGIMVVVCANTFEWASLPLIFVALLPARLRRRVRWLEGRRIKRFDALVIVVVTVVTVVWNLFLAVLAGVLLTSVFIVWHSGRMTKVIRSETTTTTTLSNVTTTTGGSTPEEEIRIIKTYYVEGALFFASTRDFGAHFDPLRDPPEVRVRFLNVGVALQDFSAFHALNVLGKKYKAHGKRFVVENLDPVSKKFVEKARALRFDFELMDSPATTAQDDDDDDDNDDDDDEVMDDGDDDELPRAEVGESSRRDVRPSSSPSRDEESIIVGLSVFSPSAVVDSEIHVDEKSATGPGRGVVDVV